ncbi:MAG: hypothetical protein ACYTAO_12545 [Planctomycetota bacterium]|jgi:hypothetical protein
MNRTGRKPAYPTRESVKMKGDHSNEKRGIERSTAEAFLKFYNAETNSSYEITEHSDAPDFMCRDEAGDELRLEITLTEDRPGDIQALLGRSNARSPEELERHLEAVERGEESVFDSVSCLQDNVCQVAKGRIQPKLNKDYGPNAALVVRDTSGVAWDWETVHDDVLSSLDLRNNPFDEGIWLMSFTSNKIFQLV